MQNKSKYKLEELLTNSKEIKFGDARVGDIILMICEQNKDCWCLHQITDYCSETKTEQAIAWKSRICGSKDVCVGVWVHCKCYKVNSSIIKNLKLSEKSFAVWAGDGRWSARNG